VNFIFPSDRDDAQMKLENQSFKSQIERKGFRIVKWKAKDVIGIESEKDKFQDDLAKYLKKSLIDLKQQCIMHFAQ
jgi:hypothetical protein